MAVGGNAAGGSLRVLVFVLARGVAAVGGCGAGTGACTFVPGGCVREFTCVRASRSRRVSFFGRSVATTAGFTVAGKVGMGLAVSRCQALPPTFTSRVSLRTFTLLLMIVVLLLIIVGPL